MSEGLPFGRFQLFERIAVGATSESFLARSGGAPTLLVLKRVLSEVEEEPARGEAFAEAIARLAEVHHANVVRIVDSGPGPDGGHYSAAELVPGVDLARVLERAAERGQGRLPRALACHVAREVAAGLAALHDAGIVSGDVSPTQVVVSYDGAVVLVDAGLVPALGAEWAVAGGLLRGKVGYLSPEQVRGLPVDGRSDCFALGALLTELVTSRRLFEGQGDFHTLELLQSLEITPPRTYDRTVPVELEEIVLRCLAKEPADRFASAAALKDALDRFLVGLCGSEDGVGRGDLAGWMEEAFSDEIARDRARWARLADLPLVERPGLEWDEEEAATRIYDRDEHEEPPSPGTPPPPPSPPLTPAPGPVPPRAPAAPRAFPAMPPSEDVLTLPTRDARWVGLAAVVAVLLLGLMIAQTC